MTTPELEQLIEGQAESPNLDFKQDCAWNVKKMAKDILAMSNLRDGGNIIIGVREDGLSFSAEGVSSENIKTYKIDVIKDQMLKYAEPAVEIKMAFPIDSRGNSYVVIKVLPFREIPIFSKADIEGELKANVLYYRNSNRRTESAPISNSTDLRDVIELATVKLMQRRKSFGFIVNSDGQEMFDNEIQKIDETPLLEKIKSKGYWEVRFIPLTVENTISLPLCKDVVERAQLKLSWSFPWIPRLNNENEGLFPAEQCYEAQSDYGARKEFWRMYQSEQFILFSSLLDDWYEGDVFRQDLASKYPSGKFVSAISSIIYFITQLFAFLNRLYQAGLYKQGLKAKLTLYNTKDRQLRLDANDRRFFFGPKITKASKIQVEIELSPEQLLEDSTLISNKLILEVFQYFGFNPSSETILRDQITFLKDF